MAGKNHLRNRNSGGIDLNPLLDVIFIILLVVVCNSATQTVSLKDAAEQAEQREAEAAQVRDIYEEQLDSMENMADYVVPVTIMIRPDLEDVHNRTAEILMGEKLTEIEITPETEDTAYEEIKTMLTGELSGAEGRVMLLSLNDDDEQILYRDEKRVKDISEDLKEEFGNLFLK